MVDRAAQDRTVSMRFDEPHSLAVLLIPARSRVLDVGCGDGTVAQLLATQGCTVWGVERDKELAEKAKDACDHVVIADVEGIDLAELVDEPFDVVLCLDVLDHLVEPVEALRRLTTHLAPSGRVVASISNVAHGAVRLQLLEGSFRYADGGLLDRGRLHLYDRQGVEELFAAAGLDIIAWLDVSRGLHETEVPHDPDRWPSQVIAEIQADPEATVYQFVVTAVPRGADSERTVGEQVAAVVVEQRHLIEMIADQVEAVDLADVEPKLAGLRADAAAKDERAAELERELRARIAELDTARSESAALQRALGMRDALLAELRTEAEQQRAELEDQLREVDAARSAAVDEVGKILNWPSYRLLERYDRFRRRHPVAIAPVRWVGRRLSR
jgi:2-polyprenyl-3-methyl-5-hydroxy-6-metoxy-1,4-benzoquinol methylase